MAILAVAFAGTAHADYRELDEGWRFVAEGRVDAAWTADFLASPIGEGETKPVLRELADSGMAGVDSSDPPTRPLQTGEFIDRYWYELADKWQYYYLDQGQYSLFSELNYILGHLAYPKQFERPMEQAASFDRRVPVFWYGICSYLPVDAGYTWPYYGPDDVRWLASMPRGGRNLASSGGGLLFSRTAGDYIDYWRYQYLDNWLYRGLDGNYYTMLGGLGYMFGHVSLGLPGSHYWWRQGGWANLHHAPEPATIALLVLGGFVVMNSRQRRCKWY